MSGIIRPVVTTVVITIFITAFPDNASAYLDPGTGSYVLQILIAAVLGGLFALKIFWNRIKIFFSRLLSKRNQDE